MAHMEPRAAADAAALGARATLATSKVAKLGAPAPAGPGPVPSDAAAGQVGLGRAGGGG